MAKRIIVLCMAVLLLCTLATPIFAAEPSAQITAEGRFGDNLTWQLDTNGLLTILGSGSMGTISSSSAIPWVKHTSKIQKVLIQEGVTSIFSFAFFSCSKLTEVSIPSTVTDIGQSAFHYCSGLLSIQVAAANAKYSSSEGVLLNKEQTQILVFPRAKSGSYTIPAGVSSFPAALFSDCGLSEIHVAEGNASYCSADGVLYNKTKTRLIAYPTKKPGSFTVPETVIGFGEYAFQKCTGLTEIVLPAGLKSIAKNLFSDCIALKKVFLPDSLQQIEYAAFYHCKNLTGISLPSGVASLGENAFMGCKSLTFFAIPNGITVVPAQLLYGCSNLKTVVIPDSVIRIGKSAFGASGLTSVVLPNSLLAIGDYAFADCSLLQAIAIPETVTALGAEAFHACTSLRAVVIPKNMKQLGKNVFGKCANLTGIHFLGDAPDGVAAAFTDPAAKAELHYLSGTSGWNDLPLSIPVKQFTGALNDSATCTSGGTQSLHCSLCGTIASASSCAKGHQFGQWVPVIAPTHTSDGSLQRTCSACGTVEAQAIPAWLKTEQTPLQSENAGKQDYKISGSRMTSYLCTEANGDMLRIECDNNIVAVERYDSSGKFLSRQDLPMALPIFGGFYAGTDSYFFVFGDTNYSQDHNKEVIRVVRYNRDWLYYGSASLYGANTSTPFASGSLRMVQHGNMLYVHTAHKMFSAADGLSHQANLTFCVNIPQMSVTDCRSGISGIRDGYVSHSFNQFIAIDGTRLVTVDHGDAYPRAMVLCRYQSTVGEAEFQSSVDTLNLLTIYGSIGANATGASVGGFEVTDSTYLIAGNSIAQDGSMSASGQRNIYLSYVQKNDFSTKAPATVWLTDFAAGANVLVSTPHLVKISENKYLVLWTEGSSELRYVLVDAKGNLLGKVYRQTGMLSDCKPIVSGNRVIWYVTTNSKPVFYAIDLNNPQSLVLLHEHNYQIVFQGNPTQTVSAELIVECTVCRDSITLELPVLSEKDYTVTYSDSISCSRSGAIYYTWKNTTYGEIQVVVYGTLPHEYDTTVVAPTCTEPGGITHICSRCGSQYIDSVCPALGHDFSAWKLEKAPTCTENGAQTRTCTRCQEVEAHCVNAIGHTWDNGVVTVIPTATANGIRTFTCTICGASKSEDIISIDPCADFLDIAREKWYHAAVDFVLVNGYMCGMPNRTFAPDGTMTRSQLVQVLYNLEKNPAVTYKNVFRDVQEDAWFADAVLWATENGLVFGVAPDQFAPNAKLTREQLAVFLFRYFSMKEGVPKTDWDLSAFSDANTVSDWAVEAMQWATANSVISGIPMGDGVMSLNPQGEATRAQIAQVLYNYFVKRQSAPPPFA